MIVSARKLYIQYKPVSKIQNKKADINKLIIIKQSKIIYMFSILDIKSPLDQF
jgi:hypothetical protein